MRLIAAVSFPAATGLGAVDGSGPRFGLILGIGAVGLALAVVVYLLARRSGATEPSAALAGAGTTTASGAAGSDQSRDCGIPTELSTQAVLEAFAASARSVAPVLSAHLWLLDEATDTLRPITAVGEGAGALHPVEAASGALGSAVETGAPAIGLHDEVPGGGVGTSRYAVPVAVGKTVGAVAVDLEAPEPDRSALSKIVCKLEPSLAAALAADVLESEYATANSMLRAAAEIVYLVDPQAIIEAALSKAMEVACAETGSVMLAAADGAMRIRAARGLPESVVRDTVVQHGEGIAGVVQATGRSLVIEDLDGRGPQARRHGVISAITVPLADDDGVIGVLNVGSRTFTARRTSRVIEALEVLGKVTAASLCNAHDITVSGDRYLETVHALALALEEKDPYSLGATDRICEFVSQLAEKLGLPDEERRAVVMASLLHDIGMPAAGDLAAAGTRPLTTVERGLVKMHPRIGADILAEVPALVSAVPIIYHHHERWDGNGYVLGLSGEDIPVGARLLAIADAYVAMTSPRAYREALSPRGALTEIARGAGTQFDPEIARAFIGMAEAAEAVTV